MSTAGLSLLHLDRMTDSTGLIQHAIYSLPRRSSGYTTDDNARALRLCVRLWSADPEPRMLERIACYLGFLEHARCPVHGFHNFLGYQRDWLDSAGTGDCQGQAVMGLASVIASPLPRGFRDLARELLESVIPAAGSLRSLRAQAYLIQAWGELCRYGRCEEQRLEILARQAAVRLVHCFHRSERPDWHWFESGMTYANAVLPHALFEAEECWPGNGFGDVAETAFAFLDEATHRAGVFWPVGNLEWYSHGEANSEYDQQPLEAATMAAAGLAGQRMSGKAGFREIAWRAYRWFHGSNSLGLDLVDPAIGSCCDGLQVEGVNRNQGAESTLAYLWTASLMGPIEFLPEHPERADWHSGLRSDEHSLPSPHHGF